MRNGIPHVGFHEKDLFQEVQKMTRLPKEIRKSLLEEANEWDTAIAREPVEAVQKLHDEVSKTGLPMIVTKRGKPVAKVIPVQSKKEPNLLGSVHYKNEKDLLAPVDEVWEAERTA
jgi:antitoxin (DNA-binding transcriptional repressor) of toxin-antitoxin stability system